MVEPATPFVPGWHLDCIADHLAAVTAGDIRDLLINSPPRHMKSLSVSVFWPTWVWATDPATRWLFNAYAGDLSIRDSLKCRRLIQSAWYQERWGHLYRLTGDQNVKSRFENDKTGYRIATSVSGGNTGEGGDYIVVDDPHNVVEGESEAERQTVLLWWDEVMSTRMNDPKSGRRVVVMQRVHESDLAGHLLEKGGWHHLCLPARYEPRAYVEGYRPEHPEPQPHDACTVATDPRTDAGALLWPERFADEDLVRIETDLGPYSAAGQLQQRPVPREGVLFKSSYFRPLPSDFDEPRSDGKTLRQRLRTVQYWDLAFSERASADYTVALTAGVDTSGNVYLLNVWRQRVDELKLAETMAGHIATSSPHLVGVEEAAYKQAATRDLVRLMMQRYKVTVGIVPVKVTTDKVFRAHLPATRGQMGLIFADRTAAWWASFEQECLKFPKGAHDDQVDALSGAVQLAIEKIGTPQPAKHETYRLDARAKTAPSWLESALNGGEVEILRRANGNGHANGHSNGHTNGHTNGNGAVR